MNLKYKGFTVFIPDKETISVSESAPNDIKKVIAQLSRTSLFDNEVLRGIIAEELHRRGYEALA
jgi:stage III sporulation protein SpoIIIAA